MSMVKITYVLDQVSKVEVMQGDLLKDHWAGILKERSKKLELIFFWAYLLILQKTLGGLAILASL